MLTICLHAYNFLNPSLPHNLINVWTNNSANNEADYGNSNFFHISSYVSTTKKPHHHNPSILIDTYDVLGIVVRVWRSGT